MKPFHILALSILITGCSTNSTIEQDSHSYIEEEKSTLGNDYKINCINTYSLEKNRNDACEIGGFLVDYLNFEELPSLAPIELYTPHSLGYYFGCIFHELGDKNQCKNDAVSIVRLASDFQNNMPIFNRWAKSTTVLKPYIEASSVKSVGSFWFR